MEDGTVPPPCVSLDLEVGKEDGRIRALAGVRADTGRSFAFGGGDLTAALAGLDDLADGASFVLGHNLIDFDLRLLAAAKPDLRLLTLPAMDTLRLSPLAFPGNPYHHLVKHYQDGGLKRGRINDPELDSRLALDVFGDQRKALRGAPPDLLAAWHWLTAPEFEGADRALGVRRGQPPPAISKTHVTGFAAAPRSPQDKTQPLTPPPERADARRPPCRGGRRCPAPSPKPSCLHCREPWDRIRGPTTPRR